MKRKVVWLVVSCLMVAALVLGSCTPAGETKFNPADFKITEVKIPMSDGGKLAADVYLPGEGKYPTILVISMAPKIKSKTKFFPRTSFYNSGDYAIVSVERRGSAGSAKNPRRPGVNADGKDGFDAVEWIAKQPWSNGKVGMWGASNQGKIQYATAMENPPHLMSIMPAVTTPITREYGYVGTPYDRVFPGGVLRLELLQKTLEQQKRKGGQPGAGTAAEAVTHPLDDGYFSRRPEDAPTLKDVRVPVMIIGAWFDNDNNAIATRWFSQLLNNTSEELRGKHRLLLGPWIHNNVYSDGRQGQMTFGNVAAYYQQREKQYFDYWLRGIQNGQEKTTTVTYYQVGNDEWLTADTWPPEGVKEVSYYLYPDGQLLTDKPSVQAEPEGFVSNPSNPVPTVGGQNKTFTYGKGPYDQTWDVEAHPDVLIFTSPVLKKDVTVAGDIKVKLYMSSNAEDTDVTFRLTDVYPDFGSNLVQRSMLIRDGILRMSLRNTRKQYEFLTPGEIYEATIESLPVAYTFLKGHQIRLIISATNYPRYDLNTNTRDKSGPPEIAKNKLYHGAKYPSTLILSVLPE